MRNSLNTYQQVGALEAEGASQFKLVQLLMQNVLDRLNRARHSIVANQMPDKIRELDRCLEIVQTLNATLKVEKGVEVLENMRSCYEFLIANILKANLKNDVNVIDESLRVMAELKAGWDSVEGIAAKMAKEESK